MPINKVGNSPIAKAIDKIFGTFQNKPVVISPDGQKKVKEPLTRPEEKYLDQRSITVKVDGDSWELINPKDAEMKHQPDESDSVQIGLDILQKQFDHILTQSQENNLEALQAKNKQLQEIAQELLEFQTTPEIETFSELVFASIEMINHQIESIKGTEKKPITKAFDEKIKYATDHLRYLEKRYDHILDISGKIAIDDERSMKNLKEDIQHLMPEFLDLQGEIETFNNPALKAATENLLEKMMNFIDLIDIKIEAMPANKLRQIRSELDPINKELTKELLSLLHDMTYNSKPEDHYEFRGRASNLFEKVEHFNAFCKEQDPTYKLDELNELVANIKNVYPILDR